MSDASAIERGPGEMMGNAGPGMLAGLRVIEVADERAEYTGLLLAGLGAEVVLGDDPVSQRWRAEYLYSRAASIYGGSAEIQRNIIARRLLDLGADR